MSNRSDAAEAPGVYTTDAHDVVEAERKHIGKTADLSGLAISGGGIRSATFGLGVMQALVSGGVLQKLDYLSTVSGGGYIGSALTWFLHKGLPNGGKAGTEKTNFPLGQVDAAGRIRDRQGNEILDFIRQHGNYLIPGKGLNAISLFGTVLRSMFISLFVYFGIFSTIMWVLNKLGIFTEVSLRSILGMRMEQVAFLFVAAAALVIIIAAASLIFSLRTVLSKSTGKRRYRELVAGQRLLGRAWTIVFAAVLFGTIPYVSAWLGELWQQVTTAGVSTVIGAISGFMQYRKAQTPGADAGGKMSTLRIVVGAFALIYGLLLGAFVLTGYLTWLAFAVVAAVTLTFGLLSNLNYVGFHRMYRDRLMETFMPDRENILANQWGPATEADGALLEDMCSSDNKRPYHLVNTNIILVDSPTSKFRARGGDNFLLSPLYCGSDATGWCRTNGYMKQGGARGMTLPTAMAISGAAVNPDAGVAGKGVTRNKLVSLLMGVLNLRLAYWTANPHPDKQPPLQPNFIFPGFWGDVLGNGLSEKKRAIEISDGGHFENLALYELVRRKLKLIILSDAGADPMFQFGDLANAVERVRVDFGAKIRFREDAGLAGLLPGSAEDGPLTTKYDLARRGFAVADITYFDGSRGTLIYLKSTLTPELPADLYGYKSANPAYPDQSTADQFFDEEQCEAYRELGYQLTWQMLESPLIGDALNGANENVVRVGQEVKAP